MFGNQTDPSSKNAETKRTTAAPRSSTQAGRIAKLGVGRRQRPDANADAHTISFKLISSLIIYLVWIFDFESG
jgi:hypothetical protein